LSTAQGDLRWSVEAEQRLERAPSFVRAMVRRGIEEFAQEQGYAEITPQVMDAARAAYGDVNTPVPSPPGEERVALATKFLCWH
jgi:hypothetical protein